MDQTRAGFLATVSFRTDHSEIGDRRRPREAFWRPIQESSRNSEGDPSPTIESLESALVSAFPRALHRMLLEHFQSRAVRGNEWVTNHPRELYGVFFRTSIEGYGSALLAVDVAGVQELAEVLKGNLDTFTMLMETFVPAAIAALVPSEHRAADFVATIVPTAELQRVFSRRRDDPDLDSQRGQGAVAPAKTHDRASHWYAKVPRALMATAFSLLTPVVLSLIVLYCAAQILLQDRLELAKRESLLASQEKDLRDTERAVAADLQKENIELLRLLHPTTAVAPNKP